MVAMRSPSWTTSPSATCILVITPGPSASTGISIFIDSRITRVSPSSTWSPSEATTFHTFATISARTSATGDSRLLTTDCYVGRSLLTRDVS
jgi:hypothetical protein